MEQESPIQLSTTGQSIEPSVAPVEKPPYKSLIFSAIFWGIFQIVITSIIFGLRLLTVGFSDFDGSRAIGILSVLPSFAINAIISLLSAKWKGFAKVFFYLVLTTYLIGLAILLYLSTWPTEALAWTALFTVLPFLVLVILGISTFPALPGAWLRIRQYPRETKAFIGRTLIPGFILSLIFLGPYTAFIWTSGEQLKTGLEREAETKKFTTEQEFPEITNLPEGFKLDSESVYTPSEYLEGGIRRYYRCGGNINALELDIDVLTPREKSEGFRPSVGELNPGYIRSLISIGGFKGELVQKPPDERGISFIDLKWYDTQYRYGMGSTWRTSSENKCRLDTDKDKFIQIAESIR